MNADALERFNDIRIETASGIFVGVDWNARDSSLIGADASVDDDRSTWRESILTGETGEMILIRVVRAEPLRRITVVSEAVPKVVASSLIGDASEAIPILRFELAPDIRAG